MCRAYLLVFTAFAVALIHLAEGQKLAANYDESKIPEFDLPDPLLLSSGARITSAGEWEKSGRPATLKLICLLYTSPSPRDS